MKEGAALFTQGCSGRPRGLRGMAEGGHFTLCLFYPPRKMCCGRLLQFYLLGACPALLMPILPHHWQISGALWGWEGGWEMLACAASLHTPLTSGGCSGCGEIDDPW